MRGAFIVIEGLDRSGKSTQAALLVDRLRKSGAPVKPMKFPDRTTAIGKMIDAYLRSEVEMDDHVIHLLYSANRWELVSTIRKLLDEGTTIICDRYAFSGIAFSASKERDGKSVLPFSWCRAPEALLPSPDLTLFLDISPEKAKERGGFGEERYETEDMQRRVRTMYARIADEMKDTDNSWITIDAGRSLEAVAEDVWKTVSPFAKGVDAPIRQLWTP
ncbi:thymidylate kinase [Fistulina hepatica ATCC 64428]|uniref:Thymidylate kinase n=1 Tax=Fistulina hepatica ATCC 64428 TaxID=1128425 RepID=A0A0D7A1E0_9AGAR|nr:thymidylate kinase [Fistulina hepatica ATCC 64428]